MVKIQQEISQNQFEHDQKDALDSQKTEAERQELRKQQDIRNTVRAVEERKENYKLTVVELESGRITANKEQERVQYR